MSACLLCSTFITVALALPNQACLAQYTLLDLLLNGGWSAVLLF